MDGTFPLGSTDLKKEDILMGGPYSFGSTALKKEDIFVGNIYSLGSTDQKNEDIFDRKGGGGGLWLLNTSEKVHNKMNNIS